MTAVDPAALGVLRRALRVRYTRGMTNTAAFDPFDEGNGIFEIADRMVSAMQGAPERSWTPSEMGRTIRVTTEQARSGFALLVQGAYVQSTQRGAWSSYFLSPRYRLDASR